MCSAPMRCIRIAPAAPTITASWCPAASVRRCKLLSIDGEGGDRAIIAFIMRAKIAHLTLRWRAKYGNSPAATTIKMVAKQRGSFRWRAFKLRSFSYICRTRSPLGECAQVDARTRARRPDRRGFPHARNATKAVSATITTRAVVFPLEGDPVVVTWAHLRVLRAYYSRDLGHQLWVPDYRVCTTGTAVAEIITEKGLAEGKLGVVGLTSQAPTEVYGGIPATFWAQFVAALPDASFEDISEEFSHLMLVKSSRRAGADPLCRRRRRSRVQSRRRSRRTRYRRRGDHG